MNGWISVKDQLPEIDEPVLVYVSFPKIQDQMVIDLVKTCKMFIAVLFLFSVDLKIFTCDGYRLRNVTHWMPLPKGPE